MPLILDPADHLGWLDGSVGVAALRPGPADDAYYLETTGERWTTGEVLED